MKSMGMREGQSVKPSIDHILVQQPVRNVFDKDFDGDFDDRQANPVLPMVTRMYRRCVRLFTREFFPSWNTFLRYLKTPLAVLLLTSAVTFLCGWLVAPRIFLMCAASTCVIVVGIVYPWLAICATECRFVFPRDRAFEGETLQPKLVVRNKWPIPVWALAVERGFDAFDADGIATDDVSVALAYVPGWSRTEFRWRFTPRRRGAYPKDDVMVICAFPFGLWTARKRIQVDRQVVVWPVPLAMKTRLGNNSHRNAPNTDTSILVAGKDSDVIAIRPFRSGDVMRDVHWSATARLDELMVKERQQSTEFHTRINLHVPRHVAWQLRDWSDEASLDWAIRVAAGLCESYSRSRTSATLELGARHFIIRSNQQYRMAMDALAMVDLQSVESEYQENLSRRSDESQVRITIDANAGNNGATPRRHAIEISSGRAHQMVCHRIDIDHFTPSTIQEFHNECRRMSSSLNRQHPRRSPRDTWESSHVHR